tara:strand:- start:1044 stop:1712 length:669 start_codon:yes stop_codon:yes gene_type:complete
MSTVGLPQRIVLEVMRTGVTAVTANTSVLDNILQDLTSAELTKAKAYWASHPPTVVQSFARFSETPFPIWALTLQGDDTAQDFLGQGDMALLDANDFTIGSEFRSLDTATFTIFVYAEHPDVVVWYYKILKRILKMGFLRMVNNGLHDPTLDGADVQPDPRYIPENVFIRRITLKVEYEDVWDNSDALWVALNGNPESFLTQAGSATIAHEDADGGFEPVSD